MRLLARLKCAAAAANCSCCRHASLQLICRQCIAPVVFLTRLCGRRCRQVQVGHCAQPGSQARPLRHRSHLFDLGLPTLLLLPSAAPSLLTAPTGVNHGTAVSTPARTWMGHISRCHVRVVTPASHAFCPAAGGAKHTCHSQRRSMLMLGPSLLAARQHGAMQREQGEGLLSRLTDYSTRFNL